jgi:hypothetical protein
MEIEQVRADIESWIENFVEVPHPSLGGWPPCPFARSARLKRSYGVFLGADPLYDLKNRARYGMEKYEVVIYAYDPEEWSRELLANSIELANRETLIPRDLIAMEDHPADPEIVNGVSMNQGTYALALIQGLSDLNTKAQQMAAKGFYHGWPEEYLQGLFQHRQDPRK